MEYLVWFMCKRDNQLQYATGLGSYISGDGDWTEDITKATRYSLPDAVRVYTERTIRVDNHRYQIGLTRNFTAKDSPTMDIPGPKEGFKLLEQQWIEKETK